jgi:hypothetical protein
MKKIQPIQIWNNGQTKTAEELDARIINDDLKTYCTFYYELREASIISEDETVKQGQSLANGNVTMSGDDYDNWGGDNDLAYQYIANQINVIILDA